MSNSLPRVPQLQPITQTPNNEFQSFRFDLEHLTQKTLIKIQFLTPFFSTSEIPSTLIYLEANYPQVLGTLCFNYLNQPFTQEVSNTELGHLFEHILIAKIYDLSLIQGKTNIVVKGTTQWDWKNDTRGTFNIMVTWDNTDKEIFTKALSETVKLMEELIETILVKNSTGNQAGSPVEPICT